MEKRTLGSTGPAVSAIGLGCMAMSGMYGPADRGEAIATIYAALDAGIDLFDTGDFYGMGHNEMLIAEALKGVPRESYRLSVKFGALRDHGNGWGSIAKQLGIKPGSPEFHRLKQGFVPVYDRWSRPIVLDTELQRAYPNHGNGKSKSKGKGYESHQGDDHGNGHGNGNAHGNGNSHGGGNGNGHGGGNGKGHGKGKG